MVACWTGKGVERVGSAPGQGELFGLRHGRVGYAIQRSCHRLFKYESK